MPSQPDSAANYLNLAAERIKQEAFDEAIELCRSALSLQPDLAEAYVNLGIALDRSNQPADAQVALQTAIRLKPGLAEAHYSLGTMHSRAGNFDLAELSFRNATELMPGDAEFWNCLGMAIGMQRRHAESLASFDQALLRQADFGPAHYNRAAELLITGDLAQGFAEYEWRFRSFDSRGFHPRWPLWDGSSLAMRTIVLCVEQGLGDTFQFIRYASLAKRAGARVIVECPEKVRPILQRTLGVDELIVSGSPAPGADCCAALLSLPHRFGTTLETIPADVPYLFADPVLVEAWRKRLAERKGFKIGIVWQGNPQYTSDRFRSFALTEFAQVAAIPGVQLVSLQKADGREQLSQAPAAWQVLDFGETLDAMSGAFMDTAAIMRNLDLVITSDTAAAHLAGGLGVAVWVALDYASDWRWLLDRHDSPWYPRMRLFRQTRQHDWRDVFERMADKLEQLVRVHQGNE